MIERRQTARLSRVRVRIRRWSTPRQRGTRGNDQVWRGGRSHRYADGPPLNDLGLPADTSKPQLALAPGGPGCEDGKCEREQDLRGTPERCPECGAVPV